MGAITDFFNDLMERRQDNQLINQNRDIIASTINDMIADTKLLDSKDLAQRNAVELFKKHAESSDLYKVRL